MSKPPSAVRTHDRKSWTSSGRPALNARKWFRWTSTTSQLSARAKRSEEHTSELQSRGHLVCRLLLEKKIINRQCKSCFRITLFIFVRIYHMAYDIYIYYRYQSCQCRKFCHII